MGGYLVEDQLGMDWLCFLCKAQVQNPKTCIPEASALPLSIPLPPGHAATGTQHACKTETILMVWPTDAYRRRFFLQPWGLYLIAEAGCIQSLRVDVLAGIITLEFEEPDMLLNSQNRLRVEQTSELEQHQQIGACILADSIIIGSNLHNCSDRLDINQLEHHEARKSDELTAAAARLLIRKQSVESSDKESIHGSQSTSTRTLMVMIYDRTL